MVATYEMAAKELNDGFIQSIIDLFKNKIVHIEVKDTGEYVDSEGCLVREGVPIPKGDENHPFYSTENLRHLKNNIEQGKKGKFVYKTIEELEEYAS
jgi:hypothetical protein